MYPLPRIVVPIELGEGGRLERLENRKGQAVYPWLSTAWTRYWTVSQLQFSARSVKVSAPPV